MFVPATIINAQLLINLVVSRLAEFSFAIIRQLIRFYKLAPCFEEIAFKNCQIRSNSLEITFN